MIASLLASFCRVGLEHWRDAWLNCSHVVNPPPECITYVPSEVSMEPCSAVMCCARGTYCIFDQTVWERRAPPRHVVLRCFLPSKRWLLLCAAMYGLSPASQRQMVNGLGRIYVRIRILAVMRAQSRHLWRSDSCRVESYCKHIDRCRGQSDLLQIPQT